MGRQIIVRFVLVLSLAVISLMVLLGLLAGTREQVYAASQSMGGGNSALFAPPPEPAGAPAANPPAAPLRNGGETSVITVCKTSCDYNTVQEAVSAAAEGDVIKVAQGTYTDTDGSDGVVNITKTLTLRGGYTTTDWTISDLAAYTTTLDGEGSNRVILVANNVSPTIEGFHIVNGKPASGCGGGVYIGGGATLRRNRIYGNEASSIGGGVCVFGGSPTLENNFIYTNTAANDGGGVYVVGGAPLLRHNTLYDNAANGRGGGVYIASGAPTISATIVASNTANDGGGIYGADGSGGLLGYNDVWDNDGGDHGGVVVAGSNSISADPRFAAPSGFDLRLQANSPCRDQIPLTQMTEVDHWGLARPFGDQADMGAHEFYSTFTCLARIESGQIYSTVQTALDAATAGDLVRVAGYCAGIEVRDGISQTAYISQALTLRGGYTSTNWSAADPDVYTTVLDAQEQGRVIYVDSAAAVEVEGFHIRGGFITGTTESGGGIYLSSGPHVIQGNSIYSNTNGRGGGIYVANGSAIIRDNDIHDNDVTTEGGGIHIADGDDVLVQDNDIHDNVVDIPISSPGGGGGVYIAQGSVRVQDNKIYFNQVSAPQTGSSSADNGGGGIYIARDDFAGNIVVQGNEIYSNVATAWLGTYGGGGGINIYDNDNVWVEDNEIYDNVCSGQGGGGIYVIRSSSTIRDNRIYNNTQQDGGNGGGGIYIYQWDAAPSTVERNDIHGNSASGSSNPAGGGGVFVLGSPQIRNNLIYSNTVDSTDEGGGILIYGGSPTIDGNTIYSNLAGASGGGGGGIYNYNGSPTIRNNVIVSNTNDGVYGSSSVTVSYSDIWGNSGVRCGGSATCIAANGNITAAPMFANPGVDFHLLSGSPCIGAADPNNYPSDDYAGYARPFGPLADMGAYEFYTGTCFAQVEGATRVYTTVQTAVDTATVGSLVKVAGVCQGAQPRAAGSDTFTQTAYISQSLTLRGGYTATNWTTPTAQTILDAVGLGRAVYITGTGAVTVDGFTLQGGSASAGGGLYIAAPLSPTVQNIIFYSNTAGYGGGLGLVGGNPRLYHNTFVANTANTAGGGLHVAAGSPIIRNAIIVSNTGSSIAATTPITLYYSDVWGNSGCDWGCANVFSDTASLSADPLFVDFGGGDFHLALKSPCVHAADPGDTLTWDMEGDDRPLGRGSDIGADEAATYADVLLAPYSWLGGIPGQPVDHPHILTNTGSISDTFNLTHTLVASDSMGWDVSYTPAFTLTAGEAAEAPVTVIAPDTAVSGTWAIVVLTATSAANGDIYDVVSNTTMVNWNPGVELTPVYTEHVNPGTVLTYEHTLLNTGNAPDSFDVDFSSSYNGSPGWTVSVTPTQATDLGAQQALTVWVRIEIPGTAPGGLIETTIISASSPASGARALVTDTTEINYTTGDRYAANVGGATDELNNCLIPSTPCRTIGHAVVQAVSGDTVKVAEGVYNENNVTLNKNITLRGGYYTSGPGAWEVSDPQGHETIVDAQGTGRVFYVFGSPTIEAFTIKGGDTAGSGGGIYIYSLGAPIIRGNVITGNTAGVYGGGIHNEMGAPTVEQNVLAYNEAARGGGFSSAAGSPGFWSNMVYDNAASADGGGVYVAGGNARIWHDTIYSNDAEQGGGIYLAGGSPVVSNTIVVRNTAAITGGGIYKHAAAAGAALDYNDVWDNTNADYVGATAGSNSISLDPDFLNEAARDLHLYDSPCENAGDATSVGEDFDGQPRAMGTAPDIGADERRRLGVQLEPDNTDNGDPGAIVTYEHVVTNTGNYTDTFTIEASSSSLGWTVTPPPDDPDTVEVGPGQAETIYVQVTITGTAAYGFQDRTTVTATSTLNPDVYDTAVDTTTVNLKCGIGWMG
ncbi:MAG TPA: hypothetical protein G4N99_04645 [Thermoflexia bacterium]|nr:hypothetical protein [Thermoflexia bacterium]